MRLLLTATLGEVGVVLRPRAKARVRTLGIEEIQIPPDQPAGLGDPPATALAA
jgi:hypothetical protein